MGQFEKFAAVPVRKSFLNQLVALIFFEMVNIKNFDYIRRKLKNFLL